MVQRSDGQSWGVGKAIGIWAVVVLIALNAAGCATTAVHGPSATPVLAVWTMEDLSLPGTSPEGFADMLTSAVMQSAEELGTYSLVERERLLAILQEQSLGSSQLADEATSLRIGRIIGARFMLFGTYQVVASLMRLDLRLVEVESGRVVNAAQKTVPAGDISAWLQAAAAATRDLLARS